MLILNLKFLFFLKGYMGFGQRNKNARIADEDLEKIDISKFNEDNLEEHQQKI